MLTLGILEVYVFENKFSLSIHLGDCDYPEELANIQIRHCLEPLALLSSIEGHSSASFSLDSEHLKSWLLNSDFEVLSFIEAPSKERIFIVDAEKIPSDILGGDMDFSFQFLHSNDQRTVIRVQKQNNKGEINVSLNYCES